jgi:hypothetical protein
MSFSNFLEQELLDHVFAGAAYTPPTNIYAKLHLGDPGEDGTANPAAETTRVEVTFAAGTNPIANNAEVLWENVSTTETYSHFSLWDNSTAGNPLGYGALTASKAVTAGEDARFAVGALTVSLD